MLSMCSLVCRLVRGWKQSEATALISQSATTPGSSLLLHDLGEPELNVDVGAYIASPYPHFDSPHKFSRKGSCSDCSSQGNIHPAFCQAFAWPERNASNSSEGDGTTSSFRPSLFCQQNCGGQEGAEGSCGLLHPPPKVQVIWCDNNRQASLVTPRQSVDLSRWTLFFASEDDLLEHTIQVPDLPPAPTSTNVIHESAEEDIQEPSLPALTCNPDLEEPSSGSHNSSSTPPVVTSAPEQSSSTCDMGASSVSESMPSSSGSATTSSLPKDALSSGLKTANVSHGFGLRGRGKPIGDNNSEGSDGVGNASVSNGKNCTNGCSNGGLSGSSGALPVVSEHISPSAAAAAYDGVKDTSELITILLEARCVSNLKRSRDDGCKAPVMVDQVCKAYAWKCRGVFGVIAHTTPQRLMLMVDAFFANNLLLDNDLHVTKIVTVDCVGVPGRMTEPTTIAECATPGGYYHTAKQHQHTSLLDAARCLSAADVSRAPSPGRSPIGGDPASPVPCLEEVLEERDSTHSSVSPEPSSLPSDISDHFIDKPQAEALYHTQTSPSGIHDSSSAGNQPASDESMKDTLTSGDDGSNFTNDPPNILVYANNNESYFESIKDTLLSCLKKDRYVIYHLTGETAFRSPWSSSTTLLVICGDVQAHVSTVFIRYLLRGGRVLSICSDFLNVAVPLFGTVEVAESPVVGVRYGRWGSVQFLHHQHCSHHSPQSNRFSTHLGDDDKPGATPTSAPTGGTVSVEPTHVEIKDTDGRSHCLQLRVLATDDTWGAPSLIGARVRGGQGRGVFSQVHLERGPSTPTGGDKLTRGNSWEHRSARARKEILRDLLASELFMDTEKDDQDDWGDQADLPQASLDPVFTPAVLFGDEKRKQALLSKLRPKLLGGRELHRPKLRLVFEPSAEAAMGASEDVLPVLCGEGAAADGFDWHVYNQKLETSAIGRLLLYSELMTSSMLVVEGATLLSHGIAVVPRRQSKGTGRGGNAWLSPEGCMMYTIQLHLSMASFLGSHLPLIQHIVSLAVVMSLTRDHPTLELSLKWPNDIYAGQSKIGGVLVQSTLTGSTACVNIGVGVNLTNSAPTISVLQLLKKNPEANHAEVKLETTLAGVFNTTEQLINLVETQGPEPVIQMYYSFWKHSGAKVKVLQAEDPTSVSAGRSCRTVTITGIDYYGFLKGVDCETGEAVPIQPDGNSFDMMEGLVYTKTR